MRADALVLLEDDLEAQRLLVTWGLVGQGVDSIEEALARAEQWAEVSGVAAGEVPRVVKILWPNGILEPDGQVPAEAIAYVRGRLTKQIRSGRR